MLDKLRNFFKQRRIEAQKKEQDDKFKFVSIQDAFANECKKFYMQIVLEANISWVDVERDVPGAPHYKYFANFDPNRSWRMGTCPQVKWCEYDGTIKRSFIEPHHETTGFLDFNKFANQVTQLIQGHRTELPEESAEIALLQKLVDLKLYDVFLPRNSQDQEWWLDRNRFLDF